MRVGIDIGGMSIKIGLVNEKFEITARKVIQTETGIRTPEEIVKNMAAAVLKLLKENSLDSRDCEGIGIACPGTSDPKSGVVLYSNNLGWENLPLIEIMKGYLDVPMAIANDADAAALAEVLCGAAEGKKSAVLLTLGTGVGGGVILEKKIFSGPLRGGCELGHMVIEHGGKPCTCGRRGCLESYASASALMESAYQMAEAYPGSLLDQWSREEGKKINGEMIFQAQKQGDEAAVRVVDGYEEYLRIGSANVSIMFRPEGGRLGGGATAHKQYLTDAVQKRVNRMCFGGALGEIATIVTSELGNDAGIIGAAYLQ